MAPAGRGWGLQGGLLHVLCPRQVLKKISKFIQEQNEKIYAPRGLLLTDPLERGMRVVSSWAAGPAGAGGPGGAGLGWGKWGGAASPWVRP